MSTSRQREWLDVKKVEAVIKAHRLDDVKAALRELGVAGLTAWEVQGLGREEGLAEEDLVPMVKLEVLAEDGRAARIERVLADQAGREGASGLLYVSDCGPVTSLAPASGHAAAS